jgi:hypothetical protein
VRKNVEKKHFVPARIPAMSLVIDFAEMMTALDPGADPLGFAGFWTCRSMTQVAAAVLSHIMAPSFMGF